VWGWVAAVPVQGSFVFLFLFQKVKSANEAGHLIFLAFFPVAPSRA
jgi:hypothetical protein